MQSAEVSSLKLGDLSLPQVVETRLRRLIEAPNGVILVAGPTGSGKSTTLAAALRELNKSDTKIVTLEDPVEQLMPGVVQSPMASGLGYTFANALRSTLRHDPDVILVGEVRDAETAQVMTQGANTGHLLLSTIHTNDSISVFKRLRELGIDESQISASLLGVLSQRLVRCLCGGCKEKYSPLQELSSLLASGGARLSETEGRDLADSLSGLEFWRVGSKARLAACRECRGRGYKGRVAIPELWVIGEGERDLISRGETGHRALLEAALVGGMVPMSISGLDYVVAGVTDLAELKTNVFRPDELISKRREFIKYFGALKRSS
jgi:type II secretory ATPase GspE/PulE/Tfp pilus assembly ATPase PilB-like protein